MILYRMEPIPMIMKNIILLEDEVDGGYVYVSKDTYDQAHAIWARFDGNHNSIYQTVCGDDLKTNMPSLHNAAVRWRKSVPQPLSVLMVGFEYFKNIPNINWSEISKEEMYGYMHELSMMIDFNAITLVPREIKAKVSIPSSILKSYKGSWDNITQTLQDNVVIDQRPEVKTLLNTPIDEIAELFRGVFGNIAIATSGYVAPIVQTVSKEAVSKQLEEIDADQSLSDEEKTSAKFNSADMWDDAFDDLDKVEAEKRGMTVETYRRWLDGEDVEPDLNNPDANKKKEEPKKEEPAPVKVEPVVKEEPKQEAPTSSNQESRTTINGNEIAKYDDEKAKATKRALDDFSDF